MISIPERLPGLRPASVLLVILTLAWIALEGDLVRVILLAWLVAAVSAGLLLQKFFGGRRLSLARWLALAAALGLYVALGTAIFALVLMAIKTGLHAHGPEFSVAEIGYVVGQIPLWAAAGLLAGAALGALAAARLAR